MSDESELSTLGWVGVIVGGLAAGIGGWALWKWWTKKPAPKPTPNGGSLADPRRTVGQLPLPQGASRTSLPNNRDTKVTTFRRSVSQGNLGPGSNFSPYGALPAQKPAQGSPDQGQLQTVGQLGAIGLQGVVALTPVAIAAYQKPNANGTPLAKGPRGEDDPSVAPAPDQGLTPGWQTDAEKAKALSGDYVRNSAGEVSWVRRDATEGQLTSQGLYRGGDGFPRPFDAAHPDPRLGSTVPMADAADFSAPGRPPGVVENPYWDADPGISRPPATVDPIVPSPQNTAPERLPADYSGPMPQGYKFDPFSPNGMSPIDDSPVNVGDLP